MYSAEQRKKAVEAFDRFGCSAADTIAELGYPSRPTLLNWWREYQIGGDGFLERKQRNRLVNGNGADSVRLFRELGDAVAELFFRVHVELRVD